MGILDHQARLRAIQSAAVSRNLTSVILQLEALDKDYQGPEVRWLLSRLAMSLPLFKLLPGYFREALFAQHSPEHISESDLISQAEPRRAYLLWAAHNYPLTFLVPFFALWLMRFHTPEFGILVVLIIAMTVALMEEIHVHSIFIRPAHGLKCIGLAMAPYSIQGVIVHCLHAGRTPQQICSIVIDWVAQIHKPSMPDQIDTANQDLTLA